MFGYVLRLFLVFGFQCAVYGEPVTSCESVIGSQCQERALLQTAAPMARKVLLEDEDDNELYDEDSFSGAGEDPREALLDDDDDTKLGYGDSMPWDDNYREDSLREDADSGEDQSRAAALVTSNLSAVSCSSSWIDFGGIQQLKFCFNTAWTASPQYRLGVITWDHGKSIRDIVIGAGHVYILLGNGKYTNCQWKVIQLMKTWLPNKANGILARQGAKFKLARKYFVAGYSRAGICAAGTALDAAGSVPYFKGVMTMGVFRWVGVNKVSSKTVPWLSWSCGYTGSKADYGETSKSKILKAKGIMGEKFTNKHWGDCDHTSYRVHWDIITSSLRKHIRDYRSA